MSKKSLRLPFTVEQIGDQACLHAVVAHGYEVPKEKWPYPCGVGAYGVGIAGRNRQLALYGGGLENNQVSLICRAIKALVELVGAERKLVVYANAGLRDYLGPHGHVWKWKEGSRRPPIWQHFEPLLESYEAGLWTPNYWSKGNEPPGYLLAFKALQEGLAATHSSVWEQDRLAEGAFWVTGGPAHE